MENAFFCGRMVGVSAPPEPCRGVQLIRNESGWYTGIHELCPLRQLPQDLPVLRPLYSDFELRFNAIPYVCYAKDHWATAVVICAVYLMLVFGGKAVMSSRKPFDLRIALSVWNALLATFSAIGFVRTAPHLLYYIFAQPDGFYASICKPAETSFGQGAAGLWTMLFIFSKVPELVDTAFIVLRKKQLIFLHWYHHVTVLLYCWHSYMTRSSAGLYFVSMNYGVHAVMYAYYALQAVASLDTVTENSRKTMKVILRKVAPLVTTLQISQMAVGIFICCAVYYFNTFRAAAVAIGSGNPIARYADGGPACDVTAENYLAGLLMYFSYFVLFMVFALERYIFPQKQQSRSGGTTAKELSAPSPSASNAGAAGRVTAAVGAAAVLAAGASGTTASQQTTGESSAQQQRSPADGDPQPSSSSNEGGEESATPASNGTTSTGSIRKRKVAA